MAAKKIPCCWEKSKYVWPKHGAQMITNGPANFGVRRFSSHTFVRPASFQPVTWKLWMTLLQEVGAFQYPCWITRRHISYIHIRHSARWGSPVIHKLVFTPIKYCDYSYIPHKPWLTNLCASTLLGISGAFGPGARGTRALAAGVPGGTWHSAFLESLDVG
jgi:hypothetical protein